MVLVGGRHAKVRGRTSKWRFDGIVASEVAAYVA